MEDDSGFILATGKKRNRKAAFASKSPITKDKNISNNSPIELFSSNQSLASSGKVSSTAKVIYKLKKKGGINSSQQTSDVEHLSNVAKNNAKTVTHAALNMSSYTNWLAEFNLAPNIVPGDGNCFLYAVIEAKPSLPFTDHLALRLAITDFMSEDNECRKFFELTYKIGDSNGANSMINHTFESYIEQMRKDKTYVDHIMIHATCKVIKYNISVFTGNGINAILNFNVDEETPESFSTIYLGSDKNDHFFGSIPQSEVDVDSSSLQSESSPIALSTYEAFEKYSTNIVVALEKNSYKSS